MNTIYLALGTNLGDKKLNLNKAVDLINKRIGKVSKLSAYYISKPWGFESTNDFVNAVIEVYSTLTPQQLLQKTQEIEIDLGRTSKSSKSQYHDRLIDIDILFFNDWVIKTKNLEIPHPHIAQRDFVIVPLNEIASEWQHPTLKVKVKELIKDKHSLEKLK